MKKVKNIYCTKMKMTALLLLLSFSWQLIYPTCSLALTSGPSQPEVHGFEPVGTTDMVDMFSGSFVYNIPLMDVEGYPVNISYHGGVNMEQEASWVGLGWNINPGTINRTIRGVPDDFNGDSLFKDFNIKPEKTLRIGVGAGGEYAGKGDPHLFKLKLNFNIGANLNISNYRGVSCDLAYGGGINVFCHVSTGVNLGAGLNIGGSVGSQSGASLDYNTGLSSAISKVVNHDLGGQVGLGVHVGSGYNTRSGLKDKSYSFSSSYTKDIAEKANQPRVSSGLVSSSYCVPIGVKNYVPVITNSSTMSSIYYRLKVGTELCSIMPYFNASAMYNVLSFNNDASRSSYGYMYLQNANINNSSILDFTRDKDGMFNKTMKYLPPPHLTYDIYNVSGQGTGGIFRPFRNDFGNVYDPYTESNSFTVGEEEEAALGDIFEVGLDLTNSTTTITSGPWGNYQRSGTALKGFTGKSKGKLYENFYFKQAGELTLVNQDYFSCLGNISTSTPDDAMNLPGIKPGSDTLRDPRSNLIYCRTSVEDTVLGVGTSPRIKNYPTSFSGFSTPATTDIKRIGKGNFQRKKDQVSEIVQVQKDGRKYVYGIPALNNVEREVTFSANPVKANLGDGIVAFSGVDASPSNTNGKDHYYSSTITPSAAHSYLLTCVLSSDYVDLSGDGPSDDDLGSYTKFNYTRTDSDYRWIAPYSSSFDSAQYNPGFWSDTKDDKGSFVCGSREQWYLHSIETKNFISEFYISSRNDALGITQGLGLLSSRLNSSEATVFNTAKLPSLSYKLDSIKLYNKHDRFINTSNATPVKSVYFTYNYSLCSGTPNSTGRGGKLTLQKIFFSYGDSKKSMISPYQFGYGFNPNYDLCSKDRWGEFKPNNSIFTNYEFPYVNQNDTAINTYASAWSLNRITLPSGGVIMANYESNDYAFVQNKEVDEMFIIKGLGDCPQYGTNTYLYANGSFPNLYAYFLRRPGMELPKLTFGQNYLGRSYDPNGKNCLYFNFNVRITGARNTFEQIRGYANVSDVGICTNNPQYGYVKFIPVRPKGGGANLHPVTYTTLNVGRYNLPQLVFPGSDPDETDYHNIISGMKESFNELFNIANSPLLRMIEHDGGQLVNLSKSFIRLQSVGLMKKGGGQRVKSLYFYDQWNNLAGGNEQNAHYGKNYDYSISDSTYGIISSGVASYEPMIGGDENPLRQLIPYIGQSSSDWPANDPIELYQEEPIGESLFPGAQIGYSNVKVTSIHSDYGKSSQGIDQYQFYTSRDFPAQVIATARTSDEKNYFDFFTQKNTLATKQGYTLIFNDMHGKPKKVEHDVYNHQSHTIQPITYQEFRYKQSEGKLDNFVKCTKKRYGSIVVDDCQIGLEEDITLDSRRKDELTKNSTFNINSNVFLVPFIPIPIVLPYAFYWGGEYENEFQSATVTKVVQQYGILDNIVSYNEGAVTAMQNEVYDPITGHPIVTSITNEFKDKEYTTNIPASWVYKGMGSAYQNILYSDTGNITVGYHNIGTLNITNTRPLEPGDELSINYTDASNHKHNTSAWVLGIVPNHDSSMPVTEIHIRTVYDTAMTITPNVHMCFRNTVGVSMDSTFTADSIGHPHTVDSFYLNASDTGIFTISETCVSSYSPYISYPVRITCPDFFVYLSISYALLTIYTAHFYEYIPVNTTGYIRNGIHGYGLYGSAIDSGYVFDFYGPYTPINMGTTYDTTYTYTPLYSYYDTTHPVLTPGMCTGLNVLPRFPLNTPGWVDGAILSNVTITVVNSSHKNMLIDNVETYTSMDNPFNPYTNMLSTNLTNLISLKANTYADSNTVVVRNHLLNPDSLNPFCIGERGIWRQYSDFSYFAKRNYDGTTTRNSGLFNARSLFLPPSGLPTTCFTNPYNFLAPEYTDPNWHRERTVSKYSPYGKEVENIDAIGNYSTAVFGYNQDLPVAVASNSRQGEILFDGFEDYNLLLPNNNLINYTYSPFNIFSYSSLSPKYNIYNPYVSSSVPSIDSLNAHTGSHSLYVPVVGGANIFEIILPENTYDYSGLGSNYNIYYNPLFAYQFTSANEYLPYTSFPGKTYVLSCWIKQAGAPLNVTNYSIDTACGVYPGIGMCFKMSRKSNVIDGWQQYEATFRTHLTVDSIKLDLPAGYYIDDIRVFPSNANMKSFVYNPINEKLMATLDENNFATLYEYDQEGNLVRVKKETTKGIMTVSESRSGNPKL